MEQEIIRNKKREVEEMLDRKEDIEKSNEEHLQKLAIRFNVLEANNILYANNSYITFTMFAGVICHQTGGEKAGV